jgi:ferredoxin
MRVRAMKQQYLKNVVSLVYKEEKCTGCGRCAEVCPHAVFEMVGRKARVIDRDRCMECGACDMNCPSDAISVHSGVGCAAAIIQGMLTGREPNCGGPDRDGGSGDGRGSSCC